ncbi:hypothetical protein MPH48_15210 [Lysinibacillus fusiformis]|uniref:hypothetical protein n=1 Tax=Lysinibacillus fusiformis TaxID=28031 RepID=UPI001F4D96B6|nr:hypothetical protein [Lysinibacillus fusiformis]MCK1989443.1 hypothetical protein [Lysinibacillus fusiformis]
MTKFNVGDKVQILDASKISYAIKGGFKTGEVYPVTQINNSGRPVIESKTDHLGFYEHELKYIQKVSDKPTKNQRITALENEVAELKLIVHELRGKKSIEPSTTSTVEDKPLTQNQQRAAIIEKAKKFVEKVSSRQSCWTVNEMGNETYRQRCTVNEFIINSEKRTVVVLVKGEDSGKIFEKGIAKCNPNDVFNEHIGKAIALGRALGLDVSEFEQAVQPTEFAVGQVVEANYEDPVWAPFTISELNNKYNEGLKLWDSTDGCFISADKAKIINDTKTNYEEG